MLVRQVQYFVQVGHRQQLSPPAVDRRAVYPLNLQLGGGPLQPDQLHQAHLGNDKDLARADHVAGAVAGIRTAVATGNDEPRNDGQRQGDFEANRRPLAGPAEDVHHAANPLNIGLHYVHADAASGDVGDGLRR